MDIFISWSGERSKIVANALHVWLPNVIQHWLEPWISTTDIYAGTKWRDEVAKQLEKSKVGILCLTPENLKSPWLLFEAGALSKTLDDTFVCPYLYEVGSGEIEGPLGQFQSSKADKEGTRQLLRTINSALGDNALDEIVFQKSFNKWWPDLNKLLKKVPTLELETDRPVRGGVLRYTSKTFLETARE